MNPNIDYGSFPIRFAHCFNEQCKRGEQCLRRQMALRMPNTQCSVMAVNPYHYKSPTGEDCQQFFLDKPQRHALGFSQMLENLPHKKVSGIKSEIKAYLGLATYYRCSRKERLIKPKEQEYIKELFRQQNISGELEFDEYVDYYDLG